MFIEIVLQGILRTAGLCNVLDAQTQNGDEPVGEYSFSGQS